jgi:hypothetical protein
MMLSMALTTVTGADYTFDRSDGNTFIVNPGSLNRNLDPDGTETFQAGTTLFVVNTGTSGKRVRFDSTGLDARMYQDECGIFTYDGTNWQTIWLGQNDLSKDVVPEFAGLTLTGDISGVGGFKQPFNFMQSDVAAGQTDIQLNVLGLSGNTEFVMPYAGSVIAISVASNAARSAGTLTVEPSINGTGTGLTTELDASPTQYNQATQAKDTDTFSAGDRLGVEITTDGSWAPTTADIVVAVIVEM